MKQLFRTVFSPVLNIFENGDEPYAYRPLNRKILITIGVLFSALGSAVFYFSPADADPGYFLPVVVFGCAGAVCLIIGLLGNDRAVAKIWGNH